MTAEEAIKKYSQNRYKYSIYYLGKIVDMLRTRGYTYDEVLGIINEGLNNAGERQFSLAEFDNIMYEIDESRL